MVVKRIVVAVDESEHSFTAFEEAIKLLNNGDWLDVIHFIKSSDHTLKDVPASQTKTKYLEKCKEKELHHFNVQEEYTADPREAIVEYCDKIKPTMLVVGSRGLGKLKQLMLGSVSNYCVQNASCPVLVVPPKN